MALSSLCLPGMLAQSTGALVAARPLGDKSFCVATPTGLILVPKRPARFWIFLFVYFFKAKALICAFQPEAFFPAPLLLQLGPVPRAAVSELGKGLELSQGTGGRPRGAFAPPQPPQSPGGAGGNAPRPSLQSSSSSSSKPGRGPQQAPGAQRPPGPSPQPLSQAPRSGWGATCGPPRAGSGARHPGTLGGSLPGWAAPPRARGEGRGAWGCRVAGLAAVPPGREAARSPHGAASAIGCAPPAPPAAAPEERGRGDPPPARSRPGARGIKGGRRAREPGPCSLRAPPAGRLPPPPTPLPARPSSGGTCSRAREPGSPRRRHETRQS